MNDITNSAADLASLGIIAVAAVIGLIAWFFVNRASVRASEQIRLLEALLEEQKRQNQTLRHLTDHLTGGDKSVKDGKLSGDFTRLIPER